MHCHHFEAGRCRSCVLLEQPYTAQLTDKQAACRNLLPGGIGWLPPVPSREVGFRNRAKMAVTGTAEHPVLGILEGAGDGIDLTDCPLYPEPLQAAFPILAEFITRARLTPYDLATRRGELKHLLVTVSPDDELMLRLVLRSTESIARIRKHLPRLCEQLPALRVASANLLRQHKAVLEGDEEIPLTAEQTLPMRINGLTLNLRPGSFFQTNTDVAAALYRQAAAWIDDADPDTVWDLFCGVGGFALHAAAPHRRVTGLEVSAEAIAAARRAAADAGLPNLTFEAGDATTFALETSSGFTSSRGESSRGESSRAGPAAVPDLIIVNPPRRGIGEQLATWLETSGVRHVLYSSCNATSLARDLTHMPHLVPRRARLLDMFPHTGHYEVIVDLERRP